MDNQNYYNPPEATHIFSDQPVVVYGGFWERFAAAFLDGLILSIPAGIIQYGTNQEVGFLSGIVINWLYFALQESGSGQATLGKKALGLKVINEEGGQISFGQATGRFFGRYLSAVILLIGYLMMLWDDRRQTLHDKLAGTFVVKSNS